MPVQVFLSHTKLDKDWCDQFDIMAARVGLKVFRSEFESIDAPAWKTIRNEIARSSALFLLVGKELVKAQASLDPKERESWKFTQNWISYEVGVACQREIDVWVSCDSVRINFPVPYLNNYTLYGLTGTPPKHIGRDFWKCALELYLGGGNSSLDKDRRCDCPYCGSVFNLHSILDDGDEAVCPTCLKVMLFAHGWLKQTQSGNP